MLVGNWKVTHLHSNGFGQYLFINDAFIEYEGEIMIFKNVQDNVLLIVHSRNVLVEPVIEVK